MQTIGRSDGQRADFRSLGNRLLIRGEQTDGRFGLVEHEIAPRALGAPMHVHEHEDEYSFVLEGEVGVQVGDEVHVAGPGELVVKPRGIPIMVDAASEHIERPSPWLVRGADLLEVRRARARELRRHLLEVALEPAG